MKNKIVYISKIRLTISVLQDYFIDTAIKKGADVEYWDIVSLVREEYSEHGMLDVEYLKYIKTYQEFNDLILLSENQNAVYVLLITRQIGNLKPFKILSSNNCKMVYISSGDMPIAKNTNRFIRIIHRFINNPFDFASQLFHFFKLKLHEKSNTINQFEIEFIVGKNLLKASSHSKKNVMINCHDYDRYKALEFSNDNIVDSKFIVFIDQNAPSHSDAIVWINEDAYFKSINRIIGLIEASQKLKVVIAGSPKSKYGSEKYEGREFYRLKTAQLVKQAEFVIAPYATTIVGSAVLNFKPIFFIYNDEVMKVWPESVREQKRIAEYLGLEIYNADLITHVDQIVIEQPNIERYNLYKYSFLTSYESENKKSNEIFWDEVSKLLY